MIGKILNPPGQVELNGTVLLLSVMLLHLIGPQAIMVQPAFVGGLVSQLGFTEAQAANVSAWENMGKAVLSVLMMLLITRVNWRVLYYVALSVLLIGNLVCFVIDTPQTFYVARFFTGTANGAIVPLSYVIVGLTARADRNFGYLMISLMIYGAVVFFTLPTIFDAVGFNGLIVIFAAFAVSGFPIVRFMPTKGEQQTKVNEDAVTLNWGLRGSALFAMFTYFVATFVIWVFLSLIGRDAGLSEQTVANAMMLTQFGGIGGALIVILLGNRVGRALPIAISIALSVIALFLIGNVKTAIGFTIGACLFNMMWNTTHPYLLAAQSSFDRSGRQVSYAVAMQMLGIAAGPRVGAMIIDGGTYTQIMLVSAVLFVVALILIQPPVLREAALSRRSEASPVNTGRIAGKFGE